MASVSCEDCFYGILGQSPVLVRALEWVSMASPGDSQIAAYIDRCMTSVYPEDTLKHLCSGVALTHLHDSRLSEENPSRGYGLPRLDLFLAVTGSRHDTTLDLPDPATRHRISLGVIARAPSDKTEQVTFSPDVAFSLREHYNYGDPQMLCLRLLATDLATVTAGNPGSPSDWIRDDSSLRRVFEWLSMMNAYSYTNASFRLQADRHLDGLRSVLNNEPDHKTLLGSRAPGLRTLAFILASRHAKVSITENKSLGMI